VVWLPCTRSSYPVPLILPQAPVPCTACQRHTATFHEGAHEVCVHISRAGQIVYASQTCEQLTNPSKLRLADSYSKSHRSSHSLITAKTMIKHMLITFIRSGARTPQWSGNEHRNHQAYVCLLLATVWHALHPLRCCVSGVLC
jgi:hypothetical protein